jgi:hypothetical protein
MTEEEHETAPRERQLPGTGPQLKERYWWTPLMYTARLGTTAAITISSTYLQRTSVFPRYALVNAFMGMPAGTQEGTYHPVRVGDQGVRSGSSGPDVGGKNRREHG